MPAPCRSESERALGQAWRAFAAAWTGYVITSRLTPDEIEAEIATRASALPQLAALQAGNSNGATTDRTSAEPAP